MQPERLRQCAPRPPSETRLDTHRRACEAQQAAQQTMHAKQKEALLLLRAAQNQTKPIELWVNPGKQPRQQQALKDFEAATKKPDGTIIIEIVSSAAFV